MIGMHYNILPTKEFSKDTEKFLRNFWYLLEIFDFDEILKN